LLKLTLVFGSGELKYFAIVLYRLLKNSLIMNNKHMKHGIYVSSPTYVYVLHLPGAKPITYSFCKR